MQRLWQKNEIYGIEEVRRKNIKPNGAVAATEHCHNRMLVFIFIAEQGMAGSKGGPDKWPLLTEEQAPVWDVRYVLKAM